MRIIRVILVLAATTLWVSSSYAQAAGDKATGQGGTNGQQGPSTDKSSGAAGTGQAGAGGMTKSKHHHSKHHHHKKKSSGTGGM